MAAEQKPIKVYVCVEVGFDENGRMIPHTLVWEDGTKYEIDRVTDIRPVPAMRADGQGDRYTVLIEGKQSYFFFERSWDISGRNLGRWFVERKAACVYKTLCEIHLCHLPARAIDRIPPGEAVLFLNLR